jgi:hypothetical protein
VAQVHGHLPSGTDTEKHRYTCLVLQGTDTQQGSVAQIQSRAVHGAAQLLRSEGSLKRRYTCLVLKRAQVLSKVL